MSYLINYYYFYNKIYHIIYMHVGDLELLYGSVNKKKLSILCLECKGAYKITCNI